MSASSSKALVFLAVAGLAIALGCRSPEPPIAEVVEELAPAAAERTVSGSSEDPGTVVATIAEESITLAELDASIRADLLIQERDYLKRVHDVRSKALVQLLEERLEEAEADRRGVTIAELREVEVTQWAEAITEEETREYYDVNSRTKRMAGSYEQIEGRIRNYLANKRWYDSLRAKGKVEVHLPEVDPSPVDVAADGPARGPADAPVTIVEFSEFQCPFCARVSPVLEELSREYRDQVRLVFRDFPLAGHAQAPKAAEAAHCADAQGRFWDMHDRLFAAQDQLSVDDLKAHARALELDGDAFDECLDSGAMASLVAHNVESGVALGVRQTPAFFINGRFTSGAKDLEHFKRRIERELSRLGR